MDPNAGPNVQPNIAPNPAAAHMGAESSSGRRKGKRRGKNTRGGVGRKLDADGKVNPRRLEQQREKVLSRTDAVVASSFSMLHHASHSYTGWQGAAPPADARRDIDALFHSQERARALIPILKYFYPVEYRMPPE